MSSDAKILRVSYVEHCEPRFIKGKLIEETDDYIKLELNRYIVTIFKRCIEKIEVEKQGGYY